MNAFGNIIQHSRLKMKWSLRKAAGKIGISHTYLWVLENGQDPRTGNANKPQPEVVSSIAQVYGLPFLKLLALSGSLSGIVHEEPFKTVLTLQDQSFPSGGMEV